MINPAGVSGYVASFLVPQHPFDERYKVERLVAAFKAGGLLTAVVTESPHLRFARKSARVQLPPNARCSYWRELEVTFAGCFAVSSTSPIGHKRFESWEDSILDPLAGLPFNQWRGEILQRIGQGGIPVNHEEHLARFGVKSTLERRCVEYETVHRRKVPRPRTWIVPPGNVDAVRAQLLSSTEGPLIVKPANSS